MEDFLASNNRIVTLGDRGLLYETQVLDEGERKKVCSFVCSFNKMFFEHCGRLKDTAGLNLCPHGVCIPVKETPNLKCYLISHLTQVEMLYIFNHGLREHSHLKRTIHFFPPGISYFRYFEIVPYILVWMCNVCFSYFIKEDKNLDFNVGKILATMHMLSNYNAD